ncbi:MAG: trypsin-like serine protease [Archangiaceae bacterium]|nr:trypsin-like serine protease [Archangiaceae bacterium]
MRRTFVWAACVAVAVSGCGPQEAEVASGNPGDSDLGESGAKIVGGVDTTIQQFPHQIALMDTSGFQFCGGSILNESWVLTAQHCVEGTSASQLRVGAGSSKISTLRTSGQLRSVAQIIRHPGYSGPEHGHDVALLLLATPLDLSGPNAKAIGLLTADEASAGATAAGTPVIVTGWGTTSSGAQSTPDTLRQVTVNVISQSTLISEYGSTITADQLGAAASGKDSCQGDSGGPLITTANGVRKLAGVVSWGNGCADSRFAGIYARVSSFESWLSPQIGGTTQQPPPNTTGVLLDEKNVSGAKSSWAYYAVTVPTGATSFTVVTQGGTPDADLYVRAGSKPTTASYQCRPYVNGNNETCTFSSPPPGTWYIGVRGYTAYSGLSVRATLP